MAEHASPGDEALMERYRDGDAGSFDSLYVRHKGGLFRYMVRLCADRAVAEELFQEVWMNLIRARASYTVQAKFSTYLYRLAHNRVIDHYRTQASGIAASFDAPDGPVLEDVPGKRGDDPAVSADAREQARELNRLIAELPEPQREAFLMQQESAMSVEDIAKATGVSRETAKSRLRYAIAKLREGLRGYW